jgi:hypothetical protein
MTVKCLTTIQKGLVVNYFHRKLYNQTELAKMYNTSTRTIHRILVEAGVATTVPRIQGEAHKAMQLLKKHNLTVEDLEQLLASHQMQLQQIRTQSTPTRKSPTAHNGKQTMLPLALPKEACEVNA